MRPAMLMGSSRFVHLAFAVVIGMVGACGSSSEIVARAPTISGFSPQSVPMGPD